RNVRGVSRQRVKGLAGIGVPDSDRVVLAGAGQELTAGIVRQMDNLVGVAGTRQYVLAPIGVPDADRLVQANGGLVRSKRTVGKVIVPLGPLKYQHLLAPAGVPNLDTLVFACRDDALAVGTISKLRHRLQVPLKEKQLLAGGQIEHLDCLVALGEGDAAA